MLSTGPNSVALHFSFSPHTQKFRDNIHRYNFAFPLYSLLQKWVFLFSMVMAKAYPFKLHGARWVLHIPKMPRSQLVSICATMMTRLLLLYVTQGIQTLHGRTSAYVICQHPLLYRQYKWSVLRERIQLGIMYIKRKTTKSRYSKP